MNEAVQRAITAFGGRAQLGAAVGVTRETVRKWLIGCPMEPESAIAIERAVIGRDATADVRCEQLLPNLGWDRDAAGRVVSYRVPVPADSVPHQQAA